MAIWTALSGWKTYIVVAVYIAAVLSKKFLGVDIPGFDVSGDWLSQVWAMLGLGALRAGVAKV